MPWEHEGSSAVIVARRFNVTAARQHWLVKHGIIGENDLLEGALFSDTVVQAPTSRFQLLVLPDQLQFVPTVPPDEEQPLIVEKLGTLVGTLPHVPYKAVGLNFSWLLRPSDGDTRRLTRGMFFVPNRPLFRIFSGEDARFGGYLSKDHGEFRLKLHVTPTTLPHEADKEHCVRFAFNFHRDLGEDPANDIVRCLSFWDGLRAEVSRIIQEVGEGIGQ